MPHAPSTSSNAAIVILLRNCPKPDSVWLSIYVFLTAASLLSFLHEFHNIFIYISPIICVPVVLCTLSPNPGDATVAEWLSYSSLKGFFRKLCWICMAENISIIINYELMLESNMFLCNVINPMHLAVLLQCNFRP